MPEDISRLSTEPAPADPRFARILEALTRFSADDWTPELAPGESGDGLDQVICGLNQLARSTEARREAAAQQSEAILSVMLSMLTLDFSKKAPLTGDIGSTLDALAFGLNNISEELATWMVSRAYVDNIFDSMLDPLLVLDAELGIQRVNHAAVQLFGYSEKELKALPLAKLLGQKETRERIAQVSSQHHPLTNVETLAYASDGRAIDVALSASPMSDAGQTQVVCVCRDITERKRADAAMQENLRQQETIRAQSEVIAELSIPIIPISDRILVVPLIGVIDPARAQRMMETLLCGITERRAEVVIVDITGVSNVDSQVAGAFLTACRAVQLLGARFILTGIRTEVAQTLIRLGIDLSVLHTQRTLQSGIASAMSMPSSTPSFGASRIGLGR